MSSWSENILYHDWQHRYYSSSSLTEDQKREERRVHSSNDEDGDFVMQMDGAISGNKMFRVFKTKKDAFEHIMSQTNMKKRVFYETIFDYHQQKPKFDIDIRITQIPEDYLEDFHKLALDAILSGIVRNTPCINPLTDITVYHAHGADKYSYHIVLTGYYVDDNIEAGKFAKQIVKTLEDDGKEDDSRRRLLEVICSCIDLSVYKNLQQFRLLFCTKRGKDRYKTRLPTFSIDGVEYSQNLEQNEFEEFKRSLITHVSSDKMKWLDVSLFGDDDNGSSISVIPLNRQSISMWIMDSQTVCNHICEHHLPKQFRSVSPQSSSGNLLMMRIPPDGYYCDTCSKRHEHENPFVYLKRNGTYIDIYFNCRRNKEGKVKQLCSMLVDSRQGQPMFVCTG